MIVLQAYPLATEVTQRKMLDRYEELEDMAQKMGLHVDEKPLQYNDGRIRGSRVLIRSTIPTNRQKAAVLCEEIGHHQTAVGNILDEKDPWSRKIEQRGRAWSYDLLIGLSGIVKAAQAGCTSRYEAAELLDVPEDVLQDAVDYYRGKYGSRAVKEGPFLVRFDPSGVIEVSMA